MKSVLNPARLHSLYGRPKLKIEMCARVSSRRAATRKHASSSLQGLLAALADGYTREAARNERDAATREKHRIKNHKLIKTSPTPGQQKGTAAYQEQHTACTSACETASRTSGTRRSSSGRPCTSNISGTGPASCRRPDILFPFAATAPKARRRPLA